jgi:hypothetical protein
LPFREGGSSRLLRTQEELDARNPALVSLAVGDALSVKDDYVREAYNSLRLPDYEQ